MENKTLYAVIEGGPALAEFDLSQLQERTNIPLIAASILPKGIGRDNLLTKQRFWIPTPREYLGNWTQEVQAEIEYDPKTQNVVYRPINEPLIWQHLGPHLLTKEKKKKYQIGRWQFGPEKTVRGTYLLPQEPFIFPEDTEEIRYSIPIGKTITHLSLRRTSRIQELEQILNEKK